MSDFNCFITNYLYLTYVNKKTYIFCNIRKKFYAFTGEELVRQYIIFLLKQKHYKTSDISIEYPFQINNVNNRLDLLVYKQQKPYLLIECKSPNISITQKTLDQISKYNLKIKAPYLMISNGIKHLILKINKYHKKYLFMDDIPL
ncbi:type I restriction enzyme HsdR N-terminal domain-containing protein [Blattabacterium cuenoti]|nr:type I restriction enzyme HsdR N-terminal domain-containing protein [Blattabacterium cuenoti]